jgi:inosine/guanosine/xanthosine phosphorylase family protein
MDTGGASRYTNRMDTPHEHLHKLGFATQPPAVALILGSGFGVIEREVENGVCAAYCDIPGFPKPAGTSGHQCRLTQGELWGVNALVFRGRYHAYEGHSPRELAVCVQTAFELGARSLVITNAAGGIRQDLQAGSLMAISDHINLLGFSPLMGPARMPGVQPFVPMGGAYDADLTQALVEAGAAKGIYVAVPGPNFETPAEVEMLRRLGADAVGMSTVPEVITARALGMRVCALSLITNRAGCSEDVDIDRASAGAKTAATLQRVFAALKPELRKRRDELPKQ